MARNHKYTRAEVWAAIHRGVHVHALSEVLGYKSMYSFLRWLGIENAKGTIIP